MIKLSVQKEGAEITAFDASRAKWFVGIPSLVLFLFLALATLGMIENAIAASNFGSVVMALVTLAGTALVGVLAGVCFSREELRFDPSGVEACMRLHVKFAIRKIPLDEIESIAIAFVPGDDDAPGFHKLIVKPRGEKKSIEFGSAGKPEELEEAEKVFVWQWTALRNEKSAVEK